MAENFTIADPDERPGSPLQWRNLQRGTSSKWSLMTEVLDDRIENDTFDDYSRFCLILVIALERLADDGLPEAEERLEKCIELLKNNDESQDRVLKHYRYPLITTLFQCFAHLAHLRNDIGQSNDFKNNITLFEEFSSSQQSAIWATRAAVLQEYGENGCEKALESCRRAIDLAPEEGRWHLLCGQIMLKKRMFSCPPPIAGRQEYLCFQEAWRLERSPQAAACLGRYFRFAAKGLYSAGLSSTIPCDREAIKYFNKMSARYYNESVELNGGKDVALLFFCGRGLMKLPRDVVDPELVARIFEQVRRRRPNDTQANSLYRKAFLSIPNSRCTLGVELSAIYRLVRADPCYDPMPAYQSLADRMGNNNDKKQIVFLEAATFCLYVKHDILSGLQHFIKALRLYPQSQAIRGYSVRWQKKWNTVDLVMEMESVTLRALNAKLYKTCSEEKKLRQALVEMWTVHPINPTEKVMEGSWRSSVQSETPLASLEQSLDALELARKLRKTPPRDLPSGMAKNFGEPEDSAQNSQDIRAPIGGGDERPEVRRSSSAALLELLEIAGTRDTRLNLHATKSEDLPDTGRKMRTMAEVLKMGKK